MEHVKGYERLPVNFQELFKKVHQKHLKAMGTEMRKKYESQNLKEVEWDNKEQCFKVYWHGEDTEWFHYTPRGEWY